MKTNNSFRIRRGTKDQVNAYTGPQSELIHNTTDDDVHLQDGVTLGGIALAKKNHAHTSEDVSGIKFQKVSRDGVEATSRTTLNVSSNFTLKDQEDSDRLDVDLSDTSVTPGSYGGSSAIPIFVIDPKGRVLSASSVPALVLPTQNADTKGTTLVSNGTDAIWDKTITSNRYSKTPKASELNGKLFLSNDGPYSAISDGKTVRYFLGNTPVEPVDISKYAWLNKENATLDDSSGVVVINDSKSPSGYRGMVQKFNKTYTAHLDFMSLDGGVFGLLLQFSEGMLIVGLNNTGELLVKTDIEMFSREWGLVGFKPSWFTVRKTDKGCTVSVATNSVSSLDIIDLPLKPINVGFGYYQSHENSQSAMSVYSAQSK